ncbi:MAG: glycerophosphodiester phosphodiesterase [Anaerolineales bacterium]|nr:MAG: glycerophosphodiester phosphodiesterase [Anaerolineales bacterium]
MTFKKTWVSDAPLVIAHRGASAIAPENTLSAFRMAEELGADAIEFDVKLSRDGVPIILHDMTLQRTTDGEGELKNFTLTELQRLDAGSTFSPAFTGERIPTLRQVLDEFKDRLLLNIELTNYSAWRDSLPQEVITNLHDANLSESILISSFNPIALRRIQKLDPRIRTALLIGATTPRPLQWLLEALTPHQDLHPHHRLVNESLIRRTHRSKERVNTWTVNLYEQILALLRLGVDGIITDDIPTALRARQEVRGK